MTDPANAPANAPAPAPAPGFSATGHGVNNSTYFRLFTFESGR